jgi:hypothetical protein
LGAQFVVSNFQFPYFDPLSVRSYGDILAITTAEKTVVMAIIMGGAFLYAFIIGNFSSMVENMTRDQSAFDSKMRGVGELMKFYRSKRALPTSYSHLNLTCKPTLTHVAGLKPCGSSARLARQGQRIGSNICVLSEYICAATSLPPGNTSFHALARGR